MVDVIEKPLNLEKMTSSSLSLFVIYLRSAIFEDIFLLTTNTGHLYNVSFEIYLKSTFYTLQRLKRLF